MVRLALLPEGTATLEKTDGQTLTILADRAFPPGSTGQATFGDPSEVISFKVHGSRREASGFRVTARFVSLSKVVREKLLSQL